MPIYEFKCGHCGTVFEELVRNGDAPRCPSCGSGEVQRLLSAFAVHSSSPGLGGRGAARSCASCSGTSCATCH